MDTAGYCADSCTAVSMCVRVCVLCGSDFNRVSRWQVGPQIWTWIALSLSVLIPVKSEGLRLISRPEKLKESLIEHH